MKEQDLIDLGFDRIDISATESGDTYYYYYDYMFNEDFFLITCTNDEANGKWYVEMFDHWNIRFTKKRDVKTFIDLINRNKI